MPKNTTSTPPSRPMSWRKRILFWGGMMSCTGIVAVLACEVLVRLVEPQPPVPRWNQESTEYGVELKRNFHQNYPFNGWGVVMDIRTNALGHRDDDKPLSEPFAGETVLFLGDSFTFGYAINVEDRFDRKLVERCDAAGVPVRTINAGMPGWGTLQESAYGRARLEEFDPDVIVLTVCGNDPSDDTVFIRGEITVGAKGGFLDFPGKTFLQDHLHSYRYALRRTTLYRRRLHLRRKMGANPTARLDQQSAAIMTTDEWERTLAEIRAFHQEFVAFKPDGLLLVQATDPTNPVIRRHLQALTNGRNLFYVDMLDTVERMSPDARRLPYDGHWSPLVHYASAEHLFNMLREKRGWPSSAGH